MSQEPQPLRPGPAPGDAEDPLARDLAVLRGERAPEAQPGARRRRPVLWLLLALALAAAAYGGWRALWQPPRVSLVTVSLRDVGAPPVVLSASGYVEARRQITLSSKAQGKIVEMPVEESQRVKTGDLIARIEADEATASLALAEAEYADAIRERGRAEKLRAQGTSSQAELDRARTAADVARARRDLARVAFDNTELRAPIDGTIIRKLRDVGEFLTIGVNAEGNPGTAVATLADLTALDVSLEIGETEIRKVDLGGVALVSPEALPGRRYLADVHEIAAMADRQKGVVPVKVRIRAPDRDLLPDMTAKVSFLESEPKGEIEVLPTVPADAVTESDGGRVVFGVEDGRVSALAVSGRETEDGFFVLLEGPETGTPVVQEPPAELRDGDAVRIGLP